MVKCSCKKYAKEISNYDPYNRHTTPCENNTDKINLI